MILQQKFPFDSPLIYLYVRPRVRTAVRPHGRAPKALPYHLRFGRRSAIFGPVRRPSVSSPSGALLTGRRGRAREGPAADE